MKTIYGKTLVLAMAVLLAVVVMPCKAVEDANFWDDDKPMFKAGLLSEQRIERIMERLKEVDPKKAEELSKLRAENPEAFRTQLREVMKEKFCEARGKDMAGRSGTGHHREGLHPDGPLPMGGDRTERGEHWAKEGWRGEMHDEYIKWLQGNYAEEANELAELKEKNPELYGRKIAHSLRRYGRIMEASKENPELAQNLKDDLRLKDKQEELLGKIKTAGDEEKQSLVKELQEVVGSRYDLIVRRKQISYEQLTKKLEQLKEQVQKNEAESAKWKDAKFRDENVKSRVEKLISKSEEFNWN